jgi:hypothetical protein
MATQRSSKRNQKPESAEAKLLRLYEPYRFLEADHWGEFLAVYPDGNYVVGVDEMAVVDEALEKFGPGLTMFKVGPIAAGRLGWRIAHT